MAKETIGPLTEAEITFAVQRLARISDSLRLLESWIKSHPNCKELWVWRAFSLNDGLKRLESVVPEIGRAIHAEATGKPQGPDSTKSRPKPKKPKKPEDGEIISVAEATSNPRLGKVKKAPTVIRSKKKPKK